MGAKTHMWMPKGVRSVFGCVLGRSDLSQWFSVRVKVFKAELRVVNSGPSVVRSMEHGSYKGHSDLHRAGPKPPRTLRFECSGQGVASWARALLSRLFRGLYHGEIGLCCLP